MGGELSFSSVMFSKAAFVIEAYLAYFFTISPGEILNFR